MNPIPVLLSALIPLAIGLLWFRRSAFGKFLSDPPISKPLNRPLSILLGYIFSLMLALMLSMVVVHQDHIGSVAGGQEAFYDPDSSLRTAYDTLMEEIGDAHRTFGHGAWHGGVAALFMALPLFALLALLEHRNWKWVLLQTGFWLLCMPLMGGLICAWK